MAVDYEARQKKGRTRSPAYPYIDLRAALEKAAVLWKVEGRHPAVVNVVMHHWGYKEESSTGYSCIAALKKFGLVDHEGMGDDRQIRLSNLALAVLLDEDPASPDRQSALRTAALAPRIHAELWERYGPDLPSDQSLKRFLVLEKSFNEAAVDEFLEEYRETLRFAGLDQAAASSATPTATAAPQRRLPAAETYERRQGLDDDDDYRPPQRSAAAPAAVTNGSGNGNGAGRPAGGGFYPAPAALPAANAPSRPARPAEAPFQAREADDRRWTPAPENPPLRDHRLEPRAVRSEAFREEQRELLPDAAPRRPLPPPAEESPTFAPLPAAPEGGAMKRKELPVPLDNDLVARVPYPMTEEDFTLLMETLQLWKKRLVRPGF